MKDGVICDKIEKSLDLILTSLLPFLRVCASVAIINMIYFESTFE